MAFLISTKLIKSLLFCSIATGSVAVSYKLIQKTKSKDNNHFNFKESPLKVNDNTVTTEKENDKNTISLLDNLISKKSNNLQEEKTYIEKINNGGWLNTSKTEASDTFSYFLDYQEVNNPKSIFVSSSSSKEANNNPPNTIPVFPNKFTLESDDLEATNPSNKNDQEPFVIAKSKTIKKTQQKINISIPNAEIKKNIVDKYQEDNTNPEFGISFNMPITINFQDLNQNNHIGKIVIIKDLLLSEILNTTTLETALGIASIRNWLSEGIVFKDLCPPKTTVFSNGKILFNSYIDFNQQGDLNISFIFAIENFSNTLNSVFEIDNPKNNSCTEALTNTLERKSTKSFVSVVVDSAPSISLFKFQGERRENKQIESLKQEKFSSITKTKNFTFDSDKRQKKHFSNLIKPNKEETEALPGVINEAGVTSLFFLTDLHHDFLTIYGKEKEPKTPQTSFTIERPKALTDDTVTFLISGTDSENSRLFFNARNKTTTNQTLFIENEYKVPTTETTTTPNPPIKNTYSKTLLDQSYYSLNNGDVNQEVKIKINDISINKTSPTIIPFRFFVTLKADRKYEAVKNQLKLIVDYVEKKVKGDNSTSTTEEDIKTWSTEAKSKLKALEADESISFGSMEIHLYKKEEEQKTTIYFSTSLWGGLYSKNKKSNWKPHAIIAAEGSVGFEIIKAVYLTAEKESKLAV